jgi:hypothetical protein
MAHLRLRKHTAQIDFFMRQRRRFGSLRDFFQVGVYARADLRELLLAQRSFAYQSFF